MGCCSSKGTVNTSYFDHNAEDSPHNEPLLADGVVDDDDEASYEALLQDPCMWLYVRRINI